MDFPVCKITVEGTGESGMASFGQGTAIHHADSVYGIQIGVIHFLPFVSGTFRKHNVQDEKIR